ncbi:hypothetical protein LZ32DRAFT_335077 [Colletotrichum eremochloae]|nr:hypothetical protein LZ32DRAFT_335077 [Colletotrichum eremochloae]
MNCGRQSVCLFLRGHWHSKRHRALLLDVVSNLVWWSSRACCRPVPTRVSGTIGLTGDLCRMPRPWGSIHRPFLYPLRRD